MRPAAVLIALCCTVLAACGGSETTSSGDNSTSVTKAPPGTLEALWRAPGEDVAIVPGTEDYGPGLNRVSFLVVDTQGRLVTTPTAKVWVARGLRQKPFLETTATLKQVGVPGTADADIPWLFVAHVLLPGPGKFWLLAEPVGGEQIQALGNLLVGKRSIAPDVGDRAIPSRTPTLASTGGDVSKLTTRTPPDRILLRYSVADSLAAKKPFVVSFATPAYCESRTCGPVVDVVETAAKRLRGSDVRFIHVEIYKDNDPAKGMNRWVREWRLPKEPFTFVVGRNGRVAARFEGAFSLAELEAAVKKVA